MLIVAFLVADVGFGEFLGNDAADMTMLKVEDLCNVIVMQLCLVQWGFFR